MGILSRGKIVDHFRRGELITNPRLLSNGDYDVEAASYDLSVGTAVSKKSKKRLFQKRKLQYEFNPTARTQETITLGSGQTVFVITHEEIKLPEYLSGTVYSRNSLSQQGILALNAGHIDPGFHGQITIKLINLRAVEYTLKMGDPIFTIVFHTVDRNSSDTNTNYRYMSKEDTLKRVFTATDLSLNNALYDIALLRDFIKEDEFGRAFKKWALSTFWGIFLTVITTIFAIIGGIVSVFELLDKTGLLDKIKNVFHYTS